jgi:hypothetical protein
MLQVSAVTSTIEYINKVISHQSSEAQAHRGSAGASVESKRAVLDAYKANHTTLGSWVQTLHSSINPNTTSQDLQEAAHYICSIIVGPASSMAVAESIVALNLNLDGCRDYLSRAGIDNLMSLNKLSIINATNGVVLDLMDVELM